MHSFPVATRRPPSTRQADRPALARRGLAGPSPVRASTTPPPAPAALLPLRRRLTALCLASSALGAGFVLSTGPAVAAPISPELGQRAVALAAQEAWDPYVFGAAGPNAFDCSGLVQYVYGRLGVAMPRTSNAQYAATVPVSKAEARPGDIIFYKDANGVIYHDGIYAGGGRMWAAPRTGQVVRLQHVYGISWMVRRPSPGGRVAAPAVSTTLRVGSTGPAVAEVQRALGPPADGVFGPATAAAVARFQSSRGLKADGVVGPQTRQALLSGAASAPAPAPRAVAAPASARPTLRKGDRGPAVVELQKGLRIGADGSLGPATHAAVVALQQRAGLTQDGVVGAKTWAALGR